MALSRTQLASLWLQAGGDPTLADTEGAIALAESSGEPGAIQRGVPYSKRGWGLWQITPGNSEPQVGVDQALLNPLTNARAAVAKEKSQGLGAWTTYTSGAYRRFMPRGRASSSGGAGTVGGKTGDAFVENASRYIGKPYVWGGESPKGFDCSGLVDYVLTNMGIKNVPRTSEQQYAWATPVEPANLQAGDLVFLNFPGEQSPGHVMIYAGGRQVIQAPSSGQLVQQDSFNPQKPGSNEWGATVVGYGRVPGLSYAGEPAGPLSGPVTLPGQGHVPGQTSSNGRPGTGGPAGWAGDAWGDLESAVGGAGSDVGSVFGGLVDSIAAPLDFLKAMLWLVNPLNWLRAFEAVVGIGLIAGAVAIAVGADKYVKDAASSAGAAALIE